jgi:hypothetical protein
MTAEHNHIERFLKNIALPENGSDEHRRQLREQVLALLETARSGTGIRRRWRTLALLLGLICAGAAATLAARQVVIQLRHYHFLGRARDGSYHFVTQPEFYSYVGPDRVVQTWSSASGTSIGSGGKDLDAADIEQKRKDLEEIDVLRQMGARELVSVIDIALNGAFSHRTCLFKYVLADGRTETIGESDPSEVRQNSPAQTEQDEKEIAGLRQRGQRVISRIIDTDLDGQIQRTLICRYVLSDGRVVTRGEGDPGLAAAAQFLAAGQLRELSDLSALDQGEFLGTTQAQMFGKTFTFRRYAYILSDGSLVTRSKGTPEGLKTELTRADWNELRGLLSTHAGQTLGQYSEQVSGQRFTFTPVRYVLSDGTEVVWSSGVPGKKDSR